MGRFDHRCTSAQFAHCTADQVVSLNGYAADLVEDFRRTKKYSRPGEGGFVESCLEHVAAQGNNFDRYELDGVREVDAFNSWWSSDGTQPAKWHLPCTLGAKEPHQCNPSCG